MPPGIPPPGPPAPPLGAGHLFLYWTLDGLPVSAGLECLNLSFSRFRLSTKASMNLTAFSFSTYWSMVLGKSTVWSLWVPLTCSLMAFQLPEASFKLDGKLRAQK